MRLRLTFKTDYDEFPIDYRKKFIHFIKESLKKYDEDLFESIYKDTNMKDFTFSVYFKDAVFLKNRILIDKSKEITMFISLGDRDTMFALFNAFIGMKDVKVKTADTSLTLQSLNMLNTKEVTGEGLHIKFLSPLVLQEHTTERDYFYSIEHAEFLDVAREVVRSQLEKLDIGIRLNKEEFLIIPHNAKKTVVKFYEKQIECSIGEFMLLGKKEVLEALYLYGMGSKRSAGFGMFEIISQ